MPSRQTGPEQWLLINAPPDEEQWNVLAKLPRGTGILLIEALSTRDQRRLRLIAKRRSYTLAYEGRNVAIRVHNVRELTRALLRRPAAILLSPIHKTGTHPGWRPLPRMRAAALARLCRREAVALGGMNPKRYATLAPLGFTGWAGISAFRT